MAVELTLALSSGLLWTWWAVGSLLVLDNPETQTFASAASLDRLLGNFYLEGLEIAPLGFGIRQHRRSRPLIVVVRGQWKFGRAPCGFLLWTFGMAKCLWKVPRDGIWILARLTFASDKNL